MDIATIVGLIVFTAALLVGIGTQAAVVADGPTAIMVFGGALGLTLIALPFQRAVGLIRVLARTLFRRSTPATEVVESATQMAELARSEGVLALELEVERNAHDRFLSQGIKLAVDGTEPDLIMDILETEVRFIEDRHHAARQAVRMLARSGLVAGGASALLALVFGAHMGAQTPQIVYFGALSLFYGVIAWGVARALAHKLGVASEQEVLVKRMAIEAVMAIQSGDNPRIVEHKLAVFLPPGWRPSAPETEGTEQVRRDPQVIDAVAELQAELATEGFAFADLVRLSDRDIQVLLRALDQQSLVTALAGASDEVTEKILSNMSARVRGFLEDEIGFLVEVAPDAVSEQQTAIAQHVRHMATEGKMSLPS